MFCSKHLCLAIALTLGVLFSLPTAAQVAECNPDWESTACSDYLQKCTAESSGQPGAWMPPVAIELAADITQWLTQHAGQPWLALNSRMFVQNARALSIYNGVWPVSSTAVTKVNTSYAKATAAAATDGLSSPTVTYLGVYNCLSPTGATECAASYGSLKNNFIGEKTSSDPSLGLTIRPFNGGQNDLIPGIPLKEAFVPGKRPWYTNGLSGVYGEADFLAPYVNYHTGLPVFGYTSVIKGTDGNAAGVVLVLEYLYDEYSYNNLVPACGASN